MSVSTTKARQEALLAAIEIGTTRKGAAAAAGVDEKTLYRWLERPEFRERMREAEGRFELAMVRRVRMAAVKGSWQAALTLLARRLPETWGERQRVDMTVESLPAADRIAHELTEIELERLLADALAERGRGRSAKGARNQAGEAEPS
jgi:hypothetical protein